MTENDVHTPLCFCTIDEIAAELIRRDAVIVARMDLPAIISDLKSQTAAYVLAFQDAKNPNGIGVYFSGPPILCLGLHQHAAYVLRRHIHHPPDCPPDQVAP